MQDLISVIVPIYMVENYLERCIQSLIGQTYTNIEIILVDDGSPDHCGKICDEYAEKDKRIRVLHKCNGGLSDARNKGIEIAKGKYIGLVDSDDYVHPKMYEILHKNIIQSQAEIAICDYREVCSDKFEIEEMQEQSIEVLDNIDAMRHFYKIDESIKNIVAWNKLYDRKLFEDIQYPYGKIHEDEFTTPKLFFKAKKIVYTDLKMYYYMKRVDSITAGKFNPKRMQQLEAFMGRIEFYEEKQLDELLGMEVKHTLSEIERFNRDMLQYGVKKNKEIQKQLTVYAKKIIKSKGKYLTLRNKIGYQLFCISPALKEKMGSVIRNRERRKK